MTTPRERTTVVQVPKTIRERMCDACDGWYRQKRRRHYYCSRKCQAAAYQRRRRARKAS